MNDILLFPNPAPPEVVRGIEFAGWHGVSVGSDAEVTAARPADGWKGAVVLVGDDTNLALSICAAAQRGSAHPVPTLLLVGAGALDFLAQANGLFQDFCLFPFHPMEFEARMGHMLSHTRSTSTGRAETHTEGIRRNGADADAVVYYGDLALNVETYQAAIGARPLDLTYMEYELLRYLASNPGRVYSREQLLSQVWGYDYYGGARTVDVHVRRLRAKLGEEHAGLIQTVRSVGYRFGEANWL